MESKKEDNILLKCKKVLEDGQLLYPLDELRKYIEKHPALNCFTDRLNDLSTNYDRMLQFFLEGMNDPKRMEYYSNYRIEAYRLIQDIYMAECIKNSSTLSALAQRAKKINPDLISEKLSYIYTEGAMVSLYSNTPYSVLIKKFQDFQQSSIDYRNQLFSYILVSPQWDETTENLFVEATISSDSVSAQLIVSALMLSNLIVFDIRKLQALFRIYHGVNSRDVKERAFVGAMFSLNVKETFWEEKQKELIEKFCSDKSSIMNILDFQKQVIYLLDTEKDTQEASLTLDITDMVERNPKLKKLTENDGVDISSFEDIISPEEEEELSERLENSMKKYAEMEKAGSDLYFKGFRMMKNFGFFHSLANWLTPFYIQNPVLYPLIETLDDDGELVLNIERNSPFCSSDAYSFTLVLTQMIKQMPVLKKMIHPGMFTSQKDIFQDQNLKASLSRRKYLQDLYRFFLLSPMKDSFNSPFGKEASFQSFFFSSIFFNTKQFEKAHLSMCRFLIKRKDYARLNFFIDMTMPHDKEYLLIRALYETNYEGHYETAANYLAPILLKEPDCQPALKILAKCYFQMEKYEEALDAYKHLLKLYPNHVGLERRIAVCLIEIGDYDRALEILYKLDYQNPGNPEIMRPLAWALVQKGSMDKALNYYNKILDSTDDKEQVAEDIYNVALCFWCKGDLTHSLHGFVRYMVQFGKHDLLDKLDADRNLLKRYHIEDVEVMMMLDAALIKSRETNNKADNPTNTDN